MVIEWNKKFEIGQMDVDLQHHFFVNLINRIEQTLHNVVEPEHRLRLLRELYKYTEFHFLSEENIALSLGLQGVQEHKERHQELLEQLDRRIEETASGKAEEAQLIGFLGQWFCGHTYYEDSRLFLKHDKQ